MYWNTGIFLLLLLAKVQTSPFAGKHSIPSIPEGRRTQYYIISPDGSYRQGYETEDGQYETSVATGENEVDGTFSYIDEDGYRVVIKYESGVRGYLPDLPLLKLRSSKDQSHGQAEQSINSDGSYFYSYNIEDQDHTQSGDSKGVRGKYSFIGDDGIKRVIIYRASADTGFVVEGSHLPQAQPIDAPKPKARTLSLPSSVSTRQQQTSQEERKPYSFSYNTDNQYHSQESDAEGNVRGSYYYVSEDGTKRKVNYKAGPKTGYVASVEDDVAPQKEIVVESQSVVIKEPEQVKPAKEQSIPAITYTSQDPSDASYSFSYSTEDQQHQQSSDSEGSVRGSYAYVDEDGVQRKVEYKADSQSGFVAYGDHLPKPGQPQPIAAPVQPAVVHPPPIQVLPVQQPVLIKYTPVQSLPPQDINIESDSQSDKDASYEFSYNTDNQEHSQVSDSEGNVRGSYSYVTEDGIKRKVEYKADSKSGFVAYGDHLPKPVDPASQPVAVPAPIQLAPVHYSPIQPAPVQYTPIQPAPKPAHTQYIPAQPAPKPAAPVQYIPAQPAPKAVTAHYIPSQPAPKPAPAQYIPIEPVPQGNFGAKQTNKIESNKDASYAFSYNTDSQEHSQVSDSEGNVQGSYSYVSEDGIKRKVEYKADKKSGFVAYGDHLPKPVEPQSDSQKNFQGSTTYFTKDGIKTKVEHKAHAHNGFGGYGDHSPKPVDPQPVPQAPIRPDKQPVVHKYVPIQPVIQSNVESHSESDKDSSYAFSYNTENQEHSQTSDSEGNVQGSYSYITEDGIKRKVEYKADSQSGFLAYGDHLPKPVSLVKQAVAPQPYEPEPVGTLVSTQEETQYYDENADRSYSFSYHAGDSARSEKADRYGNVEGVYTFLDDNRNQKTVYYAANVESGFGADGSHLPVRSALVRPKFSLPQLYYVERPKQNIEADQRPAAAPYQPAAAPYQPAAAPYQPVAAPYQPAAAPYQPAAAPYQPATAPYQPATQKLGSREDRADDYDPVQVAHKGIYLPGGYLKAWTYGHGMDDAGFIFTSE